MGGQEARRRRDGWGEILQELIFILKVTFKFYNYWLEKREKERKKGVFHSGVYWVIFLGVRPRKGEQFETEIINKVVSPWQGDQTSCSLTMYVK